MPEPYGLGNISNLDIFLHIISAYLLRPFARWTFQIIALVLGGYKMSLLKDE